MPSRFIIGIIQKANKMPKFTDIMDGFGDSELPDDWRDQLRAAYDEDFQGASDAVTNVQTEFNTYKSDSEMEIKNLKAQNFELLMKKPTEDNNTKPDADKPLRVSDFFTTKGK